MSENAKNGMQMLEFVNTIRQSTKLNGKPLSPLSEEEYLKNMERMLEEKRRREQEIEAKKQELYKLIDGEVHKITEKQPLLENHTYDSCCDYEYGLDYYYSEEESYYVTIYIHGDKNKKMIGKYYETCYNNRCTKFWIGGGNFDIDEDDTWEYTKEAFDYGFEK